MTWFIVYLFMSIEKIAAFLMFGTTLVNYAFLGIVLVYTADLFGSSDKESLINRRKASRKWNVMFFMVAFLGVMMFSTSQLLPTKKELAIIIAIGGTWEVLNSEPAKEMGSKALNIIQNELDKALAEGVVGEAVSTHVEKNAKDAIEAMKREVRGGA